MKETVKNLALALIFMLPPMILNAADGGYNITISKGNIILISFEDIKSEKAFIRLIDADGFQLWSDVIKNKNIYKKQFNLYQLPEGRYTIILTDGDIIHTQEIEKIIDKVFVIDQATTSVLEPQSYLTNGYFNVTYPDGISKLRQVSFQNEMGDEFFVDYPDYDADFGKSYNLKELIPGTYTVILKTDQDTFYKEITVD